MRRSQTSAVSANHQRMALRRAGLIVLSLLLITLTLNQSQAASHGRLTLASSTPGYQLQQVGHRHEWVERLGHMAKAAFDEGEPHLACRIWSAMAEQGDADAAYKLGMLYDTGDGIDHDAARAAYWYRRAAEDGHIHAQHNLAVAYANGEGVELNFNQALMWWKLAAGSGNADSQYNLGIVYAMGVHGVHRNINMAKKWWRKAAIKGDAMAQYNLGTIYVNGEGQVTSYCEAMRWWEKSAEKGVQQASWALQAIKSRRDFKSCW